MVSKFAGVDLGPSNVPNEQMGLIFENLIHRFGQLANETAGDHFTPWEVICLMVNLLFIHDDALLATTGTVDKPSTRCAVPTATCPSATSEFSAECGHRSHDLTWDRLRIYWNDSCEIQIPMPLMREQTTIVEHIARETGKLDAMRTTTERTAPISTAVTGQLDIAQYKGTMA